MASFVFRDWGEPGLSSDSLTTLRAPLGVSSVRASLVMFTSELRAHLNCPDSGHLPLLSSAGI